MPLQDGKVKVRDLNSAISTELHLVNIPTSSVIDLKGPEGADFLCAVNACLMERLLAGNHPHDRSPQTCSSGQRHLHGHAPHDPHYHR